MSKTLITITGNYTLSHYSNWIECESTWVPKLREKGFDVLYLMSNPHLDKDYELKGNFFFSNCSDDLDQIYYKNHHYISQYVLNETDYDYRFQIDSDTFVHPERFIKLIEDHTLTNPKDYVGCVIPYPGFNTNNLVQQYIDTPGHYASGGSGFLVSRKSMGYMVEDFDPITYPYLNFCDKITGEILYKRDILLFHDSRILFESPYKRTISDPHNIGTPFIGEMDSFLALQHYCDGHMKEIMDKLQLW